MREETGYTVKKILEFPAPIAYLDPWKGNETSKVVIVEIDGDSAVAPKQEL